MNKRIEIAVGDLIELPNGTWIVITQRDFQLETITAKVFETKQAAVAWHMAAVNNQSWINHEGN